MGPATALWLGCCCAWAAHGQARYRDLARATVDAFRGDLQRAPRGMETLVGAAAELLTGETGGPTASARPSRQVVGPVSFEAALSQTRVRPGGAFEARVRLEIADGWRVVARVRASRTCSA